MNKQEIIKNFSLNRQQEKLIEKYLKIDTDQPKEEIRKQLNKEFSKWNSRLNSLSEGSERDNAQRIINLISEARKKYK